ncbi:MAG: ribokinase [Ardenticatenia bacterium]|nr:MAG: ribokinase [Ardenticatenia bacterium]
MNDSTFIPDYLVIGAITRDVIPGGYTLGGTVTYGSITASRLGKRAAIVTSAAPDLVLPEDFSNIQCIIVPSEQTTTFRNIYVNGTRQQYIEALAQPIAAHHIPPAWCAAPLVHLGPLVGELNETLVHLFPNSLVIATPQGWFRSWDEKGHVTLGCWPRAELLLPHLTALILSDEDVRGDPGCVERFAEMTPTLVVTHGAHGATVYRHGKKCHLPTRPAHEIDPTGAGDVFAAAFVVRLYEILLERGVEDPWEAARFANVVASFSVEGMSYSAIPQRIQVETYLASLAPVP